MGIFLVQLQKCHYVMFLFPDQGVNLVQKNTFPGKSPPHLLKAESLSPVQSLDKRHSTELSATRDHWLYRHTENPESYLSSYPGYFREPQWAPGNIQGYLIGMLRCHDANIVFTGGTACYVTALGFHICIYIYIYIERERCVYLFIYMDWPIPPLDDSFLEYPIVEYLLYGRAIALILGVWDHRFGVLDQVRRSTLHWDWYVLDERRHRFR